MSAAASLPAVEPIAVLAKKLDALQAPRALVERRREHLQRNSDEKNCNREKFSRDEIGKAYLDYIEADDALTALDTACADLSYQIADVTAGSLADLLLQLRVLKDQMPVRDTFLCRLVDRIILGAEALDAIEAGLDNRKAAAA